MTIYIIGWDYNATKPSFGKGRCLRKEADELYQIVRAKRVTIQYSIDQALIINRFLPSVVQKIQFLSRQRATAPFPKGNLGSRLLIYYIMLFRQAAPSPRGKAFFSQWIFIYASQWRYDKKTQAQRYHVCVSSSWSCWKRAHEKKRSYSLMNNPSHRSRVLCKYSSFSSPW